MLWHHTSLPACNLACFSLQAIFLCGDHSANCLPDKLYSPARSAVAMTGGHQVISSESVQLQDSAQLPTSSQDFATVAGSTGADINM